MIIDSKQYSGICSCGREHSLFTELCVVERGCMKQFERYLAQFSMQGFRTVVYDENTYEATRGVHPSADCEVVLNPDNLHANEHGVALLQEKLPKQTAVLVAVGSGTIHDITRYCAFVAGVPFVSCPTAASVDGFCSSVAAMTWEGAKKTLTAVAPKLVIADLDIIAKAPIRLARSGFGDIVGKYIALADWKIAHRLTGEFFCNRICDLMADATQAVMGSAKGIATGDVSAYEKLTYGLLLSGLAMQMMGNSRPASGAEHHISHFIEMAPEGLGVISDALHGEKVGVATILASEEYHRLAAADPAWQDYPTIAQADMYAVFGDALTRQVMAENQADAAKGITATQIQAHWDEICAIIKDIPTAKDLFDLYCAIGAKALLSDIGIPQSKKELLLNYSPCVRNRLTLMRLRRGIV